MSDVDAVSLPAALDVGPNNTLAAVKTDGDADTRPDGRPLSPNRKDKAATPILASTAAVASASASASAPVAASNTTAFAAPASPRRESAGSHPVDEEDDEQGPPSPKADSEAETIIQSGRESLSPEKKRKHIRHDPNRQGVDGVDGALRKKPRIDHDGEKRTPRSRSPQDRAGSPPSVVKVEKVDEVPSVSGNVMEESGISNDGPERPRNYRKRSFSDSVDEKRERRRDSTAHAARDLKHLNHARLSRPSVSTRSVSPGRPSHQRSASGSHLPGKKKAPTPLLTGFQRQTSEDRQSTSSSASGSPLPSAHLRKLGSGVGASASPAKHMGPKKLRDKSGRTPLARACADRKYDQVVLRYGERPEDLNVPDNAGNTPLQVASLNGEEQIVKFLLDAGCEINTKNIDKDTPLIDAVENGNVEVVKLLLEAGANPRTVNASGDEPSELVPTDLKDDEYDEIRKMLEDAKANSRPGRRSEEQQAGPDKPPRSRRASVASPSRSPPPMASTTGRRKTGRSEATRNDLLWTQPTSENLREFAAKGDEQGVVSILNILQKADNASLIAAAKGGHFDVLSLMYAIGDADADPNPLRGSGHKPGYNTPMLAAIGRGNIDNIQLILGQPGFDPTRRLFEDKTYYELSRSRQGENWEEEYDILKKAYEKYSGSGKGRKDLSSPRRARGKDKEEKRTARRESSSPVARTKKLNDSSPNANRQRFPKDQDALKEKRREEKKAAAAAEAASGRSKAASRDARESRDAHDQALASSDHDSGRPEPKKPKAAPSARRGSESSGVARNDEVRKRRLIAGRRPKDGDRRPSLISSDSLSGREEAPRSRDTAPDSTSSLKRIRTDTSPERSRSRGGDSDRLSPEARKKKRRVLAEEKASNMPNGSSRKAEDTNGDKSQHRRPKEEASQGTDPAPRKSTETSKKPELSSHKPDSSSLPSSQKSVDSEPTKKNGDVKTEPPEPTTNSIPEVSSDDKRAEIEAEKRRQAEVKKAEEERLAEEKRREEEEAERARQAKEEAERAAQAAREKEKADEEERKRREMEQRRAKQAEDERLKRLEQERARVIKMRREQEAQEQRRRDALPGRLRASANFVGSNDPRARSHTWLKNFMPLVTVVTGQLDPGCAGDVTDEKWIPNYLVAPLLATNDLQLSQCKFFTAQRRSFMSFCY